MYLRSTISQERLTALALLNVHYSLDVDVHEVIGKFAASHPRLMISPQFV